jgi:hypothetical protein
VDNPTVYLQDIIDGEKLVSGMTADELVRALAYCVRLQTLYQGGVFNAPTPGMAKAVTMELDRATVALNIIVGEIKARLAAGHE